MRYNSIESLDIQLSHLGLGGEQLGGYGWENLSEDQLIKAVHEAIDRGITLFDTAPIYGLGQSEELLGKALGGVRKKVIIATKVGLVWKRDEQFEKLTDSSPVNIEREVDISLKRLGTDYIDIYQIHWPDHDTPIEDTLFAMKKLKEAGKIRCIGCCNFSLPLLREAVKYDEIRTIQIPYNLIDRTVENDLLPFCRNNNIKVLAYSPLARGFLSGKYDGDTVFSPEDNRSRGEEKYFRGEELPKNLRVLEKLKHVAMKLNKTPSQIAIRWILENHDLTAVIFGAKNAIQVEENIVSSDFILPREDMEFLSKEVV